MPKPNRNPLVRVALLPPPDYVPLTSVWADAREKDGVTDFRLHCDAPADLKAVPGWRVESAGKLYTVSTVDGARLTCSLVEGGEA